VGLDGSICAANPEICQLQHSDLSVWQLVVADKSRIPIAIHMTREILWHDDRVDCA